MSFKKVTELADYFVRKYGYYGHIKNTTPPQNHVQVDTKQIATQAVYKLVNALHNEKIAGNLTDSVNLEDSYNKLLEFYQSLLTKGKRPKFEIYDEAVSDPNEFSIFEEEEQSALDKRHPTKLDRMLINTNESLKKYLREANIAVRALKQETR